MKLSRQAIFLVLFYSLLWLPGFTTAQTSDVMAFWEMDLAPEDGWHVGDQIPLRLRVIAPEGVEVTFQELAAQWEMFEIREQSLLEPEKLGDKINTVLEITVQLWTVGKHTTPQTMVTLQQDTNAPFDVEVRPLNVEITSVLPVDADQQELEKLDLKPQAVLPRPPFWPWCLVAACAIPLLFLAGRWLWRKFPRHPQLPNVEVTPEILDNRPPEEIAYACLDRIARMDLPGIGAIKQHYSLVSGCVRVYLEGICNIPAMDLTTYELRRALNNHRFDSETLSLLWQLIDQADMVKFAKLRPDVTQARSIVRLARHFIDVTKPQRVTGAVIGEDGGL